MKKKKRLYIAGKLKKEIQQYGYDYNLARYNILLITGMVFCLIIAYLFQLCWQGMLIVIVSVAWICPHLVIIHYKDLFEQRRFREAVSYMTQMIYAFRRVPNIYNALTEVEKVCDGEIKNIINEAIRHIENDSDGVDSEENALSHIEKYYGNKRMSALHKYMLEVVTRGGEYNHGLTILLEDVELWSEETCLMQKERKNIGTKLTIGFLLSLVIAVIMVCLLPKDFTSMTNSFLYQLVTFITLELFLILYFITRKILTDSWLKKETNLTRTAVDMYRMRMTEDYQKKSKRNRWYVMSILSLLIPAGIAMKQITFVIVGIVAIIITFFIPAKNYKYAKLRLEREIEKTFPSWLSELMLSLQTETLYNALKSTVEKCPYCFRKELKQLVKEIYEEPNSLEPYGRFLDGLDVAEIKSIVMSLYSVVEYGNAEIQNHINEMISRNNKLLRKAERIENEDALTGLNIMSLAPMGISTLKIMFDLFLFLNSIMSGLKLAG